MMRFRDRNDAGCRLAVLLRAHTERPDALVLAMPRGGVPVAFEVAMDLGLGLDLFLDNPDAVLQPREHLYRGDLGPLLLEGRTVILVDDGRASETTLRAAVRALERRGPSRIVIGLPIATSDTCLALRNAADEVACVEEVEAGSAVGSAYEWFPMVSEEQVRRWLSLSRRSPSVCEERRAFRIAV